MVLLLVHSCLCQQPTSYSPQSQTKLEDIERDNLKSAQSQTVSPQVQSQVPTQYVQYPTQDQSYYSLVAPQQSVPVAAPGQQSATPGIGQQVFTVPNQQSAAALFGQQQQPIFYFNPSQQPQQPSQQQAYDFSGLSLYPFVLPQGGVPNVLSADYYKSFQASGQPKAPGVATAAVANPGALPATAAGAAATIPSQAFKNVPGFQFGGNYFIPAASQSALYQPVSFQPQNAAAAQYYYNSLYQLQSPQKSVYAAGVKSTTPASPIKAKDDQFVPIGSSNYRLEYSTADQLNNYGKVRLSG